MLKFVEWKDMMNVHNILTIENFLGIKLNQRMLNSNNDDNNNIITAR